MFKECRNNNILIFPKKTFSSQKGFVTIATQENGDVQIDAEGLTTQEIRNALCVAIHASFGLEENISS